MPTYVSLLNWTGEGSKDVKNTVERARATRADFERRGVTRMDILWTQGRYDIVSIIEAPDEDTAMSALLALATRGTVRSETLRAFDETDMERFIQNIG